MYNFVGRILVGKSSGNANTGTSLSNIKNGDIFVINKNNEVLTGTPVPSDPGNDEIRIVQGTGDGKFRTSLPINHKRIQRYTKTALEPGSPQETYVGYNGTSGGLDTTEDAHYKVKVVYKDSLRLIANRAPMTMLYYNVESGDGQYEVATGLFKDGLRQSYRWVDIDRVADGSDTILGGTSQVANVVRGSKTVTLDVALSTAVAAGTVVKIKGIAYTVTGGDTTTIILDEPYTGITESITVSSASDFATSSGVSNWGLKFTGMEIPTESINKFQYVVFSIAQNLETAEVTDTPVVPPMGIPILIKEKEMEFSGMLGYTDHRTFYEPEFPYSSDQSISGYDQIQIVHLGQSMGDFQDTMNHPMQTHIAFSAEANTQRDAVVTILDSWMNAAGYDDTTF